MKAREVKRAKLVAKYAEKRKALKEAGDWAVRHQPYPVPRDGQQRSHPRGQEGKLVKIKKEIYRYD